MNVELTVISDCTTCGLCCEGLRVPPFDYDEHKEPFEGGMDDLELPPEALQEIRDAMNADDWKSTTKPCCWFDSVNRLCRYYEFRPDACAQFEPGNPVCQEILESEGLSHAHPHEYSL